MPDSNVVPLYQQIKEDIKAASLSLSLVLPHRGTFRTEERGGIAAHSAAICCTKV